MSNPTTFSDMMMGALQQNNQFAIFDVIKEKAKEHKHLMYIASKIEKAVSNMDFTEISTNIYMFTLLISTKEMVDVSPNITEVMISALRTHPTFAGVDLNTKTFNPLDFGIVLLPADGSLDANIEKAGKKIPMLSNALTELSDIINNSDTIHSLMTITLPIYDNAKYVISQVVF